MTTPTSPRRPGGAEAMREAAANVAERMTPHHFHHETAAAIRALPLTAGDTLSTGGWNSDMELDEPRLKRAAEALIAEAGAIRSGLGMGPISTSVGGISAGNYRLLRAAIRAALPEIFAPEPPLAAMTDVEPVGNRAVRYLP